MVMYSSSEETTMGIPLDDTTDNNEAEDDPKRDEKEKRNENKKRGVLIGSKPKKTTKLLVSLVVMNTKWSITIWYSWIMREKYVFPDWLQVVAEG